MREPKALVRELVRAYNAKALDDVVALYRDDARYWDPLHRDGVHGRDAIRRVVSELFAHFPDERMTIETLAADDVVAVAELVSTGTATGGAPFRLELTEVYETRDGSIAACRAYLDPEQLPPGLRGPTTG
jgi:uncharacterized protein (TIGR02246 family)